ncbi:MAG TPA: pyridoxal-phosphate dependent enzyme [Methanomassiliicoccaceae archaeon]|nr:pyridoxal-phosphate dependent enzyme [Methanomassiliicoccaceae archaeon]
MTIGNTPLVRINKLNPNKNVTMYAKVEGFNPTGSIKDRIALNMIQQAGMCASGTNLLQVVLEHLKRFLHLAFGGFLELRNHLFSLSNRPACPHPHHRRRASMRQS